MSFEYSRGRGRPAQGLTLEDMRQYAERDPSAMTKLAAHFEVSTSEAASRIEAGAISQAAARRALGDAPWLN